MTEPIISPEVQACEADIQDGITAEQWQDSPLGRLVIARAEREREAALEALVTIDPEDAHGIRVAQNQIHVIDGIQQWLAEAIMQAQSAIIRLDQMDAEG